MSSSRSGHSFRISDESYNTLVEYSTKWNISQSSILENLINFCLNGHYTATNGVIIPLDFFAQIAVNLGNNLTTSQKSVIQKSKNVLRNNP